MKRKKLTMLLACIIAGTFIAGCGSTTPAETNLKDKVVNDKDNNTDVGNEGANSVSEPMESFADPVSEEDKAGAGTDTNQNSEPEENPYDGGPDWVTLADEFTLPTNRMCIEDAVAKYSITLYDDGRYFDYEGDIGDVIPQYKDRDLDGDHKPDVIRREGQHYVFELTRKGTFSTDDYSASPNEGEVIQFQDLGCRNYDEIEIVHV